MKMNIKTNFFGIGALALVVVFLILSVDVSADINLTTTGVNISDIYGGLITNLTINISNSTDLYNCTTDNYGYCELGIGNFSINFTYCNNAYNFSVSINNGEVKNLTLNISSTCQIPNSCNANENCSDNQNCYNGYCKDLKCNAGYIAKNHQCEFAIGCTVGAKIGGKVEAKVGAKIGANSLIQKVSEISGCTTLTESDKTYILTQDINTSDNTCINILANNVVLDCRWHKISSNGENVGIEINGNKVMVENCIIENFSNGIMINGNESTIYCNEIQENYIGIGNSGDRINTKIYKNLVRHNDGAGIGRDLRKETGISIEANEIIKNNVGIYGYEIVSQNNSPDLSNNVVCSNNVNVNFSDYSSTGNCTLPDLAITKIHVPLISDGNLTINVTAENLFTNLYNNSAVVSIVIEGNNQTIVENKTINANIPIQAVSFNFSLPSGIYFVTASMSSVSEINESNNLNNALSNAVAVIKENQSIIYGKTEHFGRLLPNINLAMNNSNTGEILNLSSDENGFFEIVVDEGNYTLRSIYSRERIINVRKNSFLNLNISLNLITFNVTDFNNISLEGAKITIIDVNTTKGVTLFTNKNGIAEFMPLNGHTYKFFMFKDRYAFYESTNQTYPSYTEIHIFTEECIESPKNIFSFENYTLKIYNDLQNKIKQNKIKRAIFYSINKKNMSGGSVISAKLGARIDQQQAKCIVNITNIPENLTVSMIINGTNESSAENSSFNGVKNVTIKTKVGNRFEVIGAVSINFTYKNPDFGNVIAKSGEIGDQNLSYAILHLDVNKTNKIGEKILYLPVKHNTGIVCVNNSATTLDDINNMIENDCNGNWRSMDENDTVTFGNYTYYKVISNGTGAVELNFVLGDANKNNMLDLEDIFKIIEHNIIDSNIPPRADINNDKVIDIFDVVEILENISQ